MMIKYQLGLTKIYNQYHNIAIANNYDNMIILTLKKLLKTEEEVFVKEFIYEICKLRQLQIKMDEAVSAIYEWNDISFDFNFYEQSYLPENDNIRFTIHPDTRKEILKRLLLLNHTSYKFEVENKKL